MPAKHFSPAPVPSRSSTSESSSSYQSQTSSSSATTTTQVSHNASNPNSATPSNGSGGHGLRTQLGHLLPRHALFQVSLDIEELANVPLVKGQFAVRWKFKNVQSGSGLLAKMKNGHGAAGGGGGGLNAGARNTSGGSYTSIEDESNQVKPTWIHKVKDAREKGKAKATIDTHTRFSHSSPYLLSEPKSGSGSGRDDASTNSKSSASDWDSFRTPVDEDAPDSPWTMERHANTSTQSHSSDASSVYPHFPHLPHLSSNLPDSPQSLPPTPPASHSASATPTITKYSTEPPVSLANTPYSKKEAKGMTEWVELHNYNAKWGHRVNVVLQMDVHRETGDLLPSELKLVVMQRVIPGDPDAPRNPRLGAVYLNLAEYADAGTVTRRYLLRESKINATLKLSIKLTHIGGTRDFKPPPLRKGEIMAEVTGLLSNNDLLRTRLARTLDLYSNHQEDEDEYHDAQEAYVEDEQEDPSTAIPLTHAKPKPRRFSSEPKPLHEAIENANEAAGKGRTDFDKLASLNGLRTTETLIEAIFNPIPSTSPEPSPFTYYDPLKAGSGKARANNGVEDKDERRSLAESTRTGESFATTGTGSENGSAFTRVSHPETSSYVVPTPPYSTQRNRKASSTYARSEHSHSGSSSRSGSGSAGFSNSDFGLSPTPTHSASQGQGTKTHWWQKMSSPRTESRAGGGEAIGLGLSSSRPGTPANGIAAGLGAVHGVGSGSSKKLFSSSTSRLPLEVE